MAGKAPQGRMMTLDGMRGVAALLVVAYHVLPRTTGSALLPRGYLAVDFFFMLSGFVMTCAYEARFRSGLSFTPFIKARLWRLYPTIFIGILIGGLAAVSGGASPLETAVVLVAELLFLPWLSGGRLGVFQLDGVQWSLLFELVANVAHERILQRLGFRGLMLFALLAFAALLAVAQHFGSLAVGDRGVNFFAGLPRVFFPYLIGILIARLHEMGRLPSRCPGGLMSILLLALLIVSVGLVPARWDGWWIEAAVVALAFPMLIIWGSRGVLAGRAIPIAEAAGALSFPLYAVHIPAINLVLVVALPWLGEGSLLLALALVATACGALAVQHILSWHNATTPARRGFKRHGLADPG